MSENGPMVYVDSAIKDAGLPLVGGAKKCVRPDCPAPTFETGFGLAGGGFGVYEYCSVCEMVVSKTISRDED